ncbi:hypothetical protein [Gracilibacillus oryzae]
MKTGLVLTGISKQEDIMKLDIKPDFIFSCIDEVVKVPV